MSFICPRAAGPGALRSTDLEVSLAVAHEVGVKKPQHLVRSSAALTGESPAGFRSRYRSAPDASAWASDPTGACCPHRHSLALPQTSTHSSPVQLRPGPQNM